jgi:hypothetical protein
MQTLLYSSNIYWDHWIFIVCIGSLLPQSYTSGPGLDLQVGVTVLATSKPHIWDLATFILQKEHIQTTYALYTSLSISLFSSQVIRILIHQSFLSNEQQLVSSSKLDRALA